MIRLFVTGKYGDAYSIASISPLRLRDHQRLAQGYLLTRPGPWLVVDSTQEIPRGTDPGWDALVAGWDALTASMATTAPPTKGRSLPGHARRGHRCDRAHHHRHRVRDSYPYREAMPTAGARSGATQSYEFALAGSAPRTRAPSSRSSRGPTQGHRHRKATGPGHPGQRDAITIRFDEPVDWNDLRGQGEITTTTSTVVFRMQREALHQLRTGRARNPGVLQALVDGRPAPRPRRAAATPWKRRRVLRASTSTSARRSIRRSPAPISSR